MQRMFIYWQSIIPQFICLSKLHGHSNIKLDQPTMWCGQFGAKFVLNAGKPEIKCTHNEETISVVKLCVMLYLFWAAVAQSA